jgi:hypothetical protein
MRHPGVVVLRLHLGRILLVAAAIGLAAGAAAQQQARVDLADAPAVSLLPALAIPVSPSPLNENRILGVIPDYQTVRDTTVAVAPLTPKQKWSLAFRETVDPFNIASAAMAAGFSQMGNQTPKYGEGSPAYGKRFGAALADFGTQGIFSAGILANVLHQDPRYFRKGPQSGILKRVAYSVSRLVIAKQDSGASAFNASGIFGTVLGIAASNLYYPAASIRGSVMVGRLNTSFTGGIMGNLMSEFWPDIQKKFFHRKRPIQD